MPPPPPAPTSPPADPVSTLSRARSSRISNLFSRYEAALSSSSPPPGASSASLPSSTGRRPGPPLPRARLSDPGAGAASPGRVQRHVRRFSGDPSTAVSSAMAAGKAAAAKTVVVPARVSAPVAGSDARVKVSVETAEEDKTSATEQGPADAAAIAPPPPPPLVEPPKPAMPRPETPPPLLETRRPSIAFVEATPPRHAQTRSSSAPASAQSPSMREDRLHPSAASSRPPRPRLPRESPAYSPPQTPSSAKPVRPVLIRPSTASDKSSSSSIPTLPAYTASSRSFSVPPTPSSGCTTSTSATRPLPAYRLFARDADPLVLPDLDRVLRELGGPARFTPMPGLEDVAGEARNSREKATGKDEDEELELESLSPVGHKSDRTSNSMRDANADAWQTWLRGPAPSRWSRLVSFLLRRSPRDVAAASTAARQKRALIFPPFHLLPPELSVTDLKANRRKPPPLLSFQSLVLKASNGLVGAATSGWGIKLTTLEGLRDLAQMITLLVTAGSPTLSTLTAGASDTEPAATDSTAFRTLFITVPSFLSLDFVTPLATGQTQALVLLLVLALITLAALFEFYLFTGGWHGPNGALGKGKLDLGEGYDREDLGEKKKSWRDSYAWKILVTFWITSLYLPLCKLAIGALFWTDDFWAVSPAVLAQASPPSLGPSSDFYPTTDICYRTTMRRPSGLDHLNYSPVVLIFSGVVVALLGCWLPWRMSLVVKREAPRIDAWTELGERRRDKNGEYERLLDSDASPFNFLYREYRRPWAHFRSIYLGFKLVNVFIAVILQPTNCAFRSFSETYLGVVRQGCLLAIMGSFFVLSAWSSPYLDVPSNSSDLISRLGYAVLAMLGLLDALGFDGTDGAVVAANVVLYGMTIYFALVGTGYAQKLVKRFQRRIDFSIDIFSPRIDLSKHLSRRIWQETIAALFLCSPDFAMSAKQKLSFTKDDNLPPYLLGFQGSVAERFVENLKILREIGLDAYSDAVSYRDLPSDAPIMRLRRLIQTRFAGPDTFYHSPHLHLPITSFFGRLEVVPFPFVCVFRYDQHPSEPLLLSSLDDLERLVHQNELPAVTSRRKVRLALRALEGETIDAPYVEVRRLGSSGGGSVERHIHYRHAVLRIERNSAFRWCGYNYSSGFSVKLEYADGEGPDRDGLPLRNQHLTLAGHEFGVFDDFPLNQALASVFLRNRANIDRRLPFIERTLQSHRDHFRHEADRKHRTLSHAFLLSVFAEDRLSSSQLDYVLRSSEHNPAVRDMARTHEAVWLRLEERMDAVKASGLRGWWALCWDDLWRRNSDIKGLADRPEDFSPHYSSSICYNPMPRADLEAFLQERGFRTHGPSAYFHVGFLNQLYFYLDETVFGTTSRAIPIHLGNSSTPAHERIPFAALPDRLAHQHLSPPSPIVDTSLSSPTAAGPTRTGARNVSHGTVLSRLTADTGGGTQEDDSIRLRPAFLFEEAFERPHPRFSAGQRWRWVRFQLGEGLRDKAAVWLGLRTVMADWRPSEEEGVVLELRKSKAGWELPSGRSKRDGGDCALDAEKESLVV
ncbi:hypothetical protein JCM10207_000034 [Rhodosporidiobolus poonsookiae]